MEVVKLLALIFLPVVAPVGVAIFVGGRGHRKYNSKKSLMRKLFIRAKGVLYSGFKSLKLNADRGLFNQPLLWLSILVPVFYFFAFGSLI